MKKTTFVMLFTFAIAGSPALAEEATSLTIKPDTWDFKGDPGPVKQIYKWKDAEGTWHYSQSPPQNGSAITPVSTMTVDASTNIIKGMSDEEINQVLGKVDEIIKKRDATQSSGGKSKPSEPAGVSGCGTVFGVKMPEWMTVPLSVSCADLEKMRQQIEEIKKHREQYINALDNIPY